MSFFERMVLAIALWPVDFVTHVGDLTQNAVVVEFERTMTVMRRLIGIHPYLICPGNHDYTGGMKPPAGNLALFEQMVGPANTWFLDPRLRFLAINLEWLPRDVAIALARALMELVPDVPTILTTHEFVLRDGTRSTYGADKDGDRDNSGQELFEKLVQPYPQVVMVLCGHSHGEARRTDTTLLGRQVHQLLFNAQDDPYGGQGFQRLVYFGPLRIDVLDLTVSNRGLPPDRTQWFTLPLNTVGIPRAVRSTRGADTFVASTIPNSNRGQLDQVQCSATAGLERGLLRFDLPAGLSSCSRAILTLSAEGYDADGDGFRLHRMLRPWTEASTWASLGGVRVGVDALPVPDADSGTLGKGTFSLDVTAPVGAWLRGEPNHGWLVEPRGSSTRFRSFDWRAPTERPLLTIVP
jgi:hypothetical protein